MISNPVESLETDGGPMLLNVAQVARELAVSESYVTQKLLGKALPRLLISNRIRVPRAAVIAYIESLRQASQ